MLQRESNRRCADEPASDVQLSLLAPMWKGDPINTDTWAVADAPVADERGKCFLMQGNKFCVSVCACHLLLAVVQSYYTVGRL